MERYATVKALRRKASQLSPGDLIVWNGAPAVVTTIGTRYGRVQLTLVTNDARVQRVSVMRSTGITVR